MVKIFTRYFVIALLFLNYSGFGQSSDDSNLYLKNGVIKADSSVWIHPEQAQRLLAGSRRTEPMLSILRLNKSLSTIEIENLKDAGIYVQGYLPNKAWVALISEQKSELGALSPYGFSGLLEITPEMKVAPRLLEGKLLPHAMVVNGMADLWIKFPNYFSADSLRNWLKADNITLRSEEFIDFGILEIRVPIPQIAKVAEKCYVEFIQEKPAPLTVENYKSGIGSRANFLRSPSSFYPDGLKGRGVVIGIGDDTDPLRHIDFAGRLINRFDGTGGQGHGLHTMGTMAGGGIVREELAGYAPKSTIVSQYFSNILAYSLLYYEEYGMRLTNNSYGNTITGDESFRQYDLTSWIVDYLSVEKPDLLHVFAAGNSGLANYSQNPYRQVVTGVYGHGTILSGYQTAKNSLVVGNIDSLNRINNQSSRGPVADGRLRPDVVAPGVRIMSLQRENNYGVISGTSMAAPAVTGGAALLMEQYKRQYPSAGDPPAGLIKALILNGSTDLENKGPDYTFGHGALNLYRSSAILRNEHFSSGTLTTGNSHQLSLEIPANTAQLKVLLYWVDPPAAVMASKALVNDLDLTVTDQENTYLPLVNSIVPAASVTLPATPKIDRTNNSEQIIIDQPTPGNVTITVSGYHVPVGPQEYFLVYDLIPNDLVITSPAKEDRFLPGERIQIAWESYGVDSDYKIEFFDGSTWSTLQAALQTDTHVHFWNIPSQVRTHGAKIRITRNADQKTYTSEEFTVLGKPVISIPSAQQCEGLIKMNWTAVNGATEYEVMMLQGDEMKTVDTVPSGHTSYYFTGLSPDSTYWVTVRALMDGKPGRRANALSRRPNTGACNEAISKGDLAVTELVAPVSGRKWTSTALSEQTTIQFKVKNRYAQASSGKTVLASYKVNNLPTITEPVNIPSLAAMGEAIISFNTKFNFSEVGDYHIEVNLNVEGDPIPANNKLITEITHAPNPPIELSQLSPTTPIEDHFASMPVIEYYRQKIGLSGAERFDFMSNKLGGRIRSYINKGFAFSDQRALTMDAYRYPRDTTVNQLIATYNLTNYDLNADLRLTFWYLSHKQQPYGQNKVWVRGSDTQDWIELFDLSAELGEHGDYQRSPSLSITDALRSHGQQFSSSTQIRWSQVAMYPAVSPKGIEGFTFDNIQLTVAHNDLIMKEIVAPVPTSCQLGEQASITVRIENSVGNPVFNVPVSYQIDSRPIVTEYIERIDPNSELDYTFSTPGDFSTYKIYNLRVWVSAEGDHDELNNELTTTLSNSLLVTQFPYLEDFENGDGHWFTQGKNSSWEFGTPSSTRINRAASGVNAWKTNLTGFYNEEEHSYLYSPCFYIGGISKPMLSFMLALDIENCTTPTICDAAWVEYSYDGVEWSVLGNKDEGTNWYNKASSGNPHWAIASNTHWHVATIPLPVPTHPSQEFIRLRFVMVSDLAVNREGVALDDIHIYDQFAEISSSNGAGSEISHTIASNDAIWTHFMGSDGVAVSLNPNHSTPNPGLVNAKYFVHNGTVRNAENTYYHHRNFVIQPEMREFNPGMKVRLYLPDSEMEVLRTATGCSSCLKPQSVIDLGISKYSGSLGENGNISDNTSSGYWEYIEPSDVTKVPYANGYYLEFTTSRFSEFWLAPGPLFNSSPLPVNLASFNAMKGENDEAILEWMVTEANNFSYYEIQKAIGNEAMNKGNFTPLAIINPVVSKTGSFRYIDYNPGSPVVYYRLKMVDSDGSFTYSEVRSVMIDTIFQPFLYPNPSADDVFFLHYQTGETVNFTVRDVQGRSLKTGSIVGNGFLQKMPIDLKGYSSGVYLVEVETSQNKSILRLIKK